jgi:hypothetical protein
MKNKLHYSLKSSFIQENNYVHVICTLRFFSSKTTGNLKYLCKNQDSLRSRRLVRAGEERASLNKRLPKCLGQICSSPKNLRKSFPLVNLVNGSNYVTQMSTTILLAYRNSDSRIFLIKICLLMLWRKLFLIFQVFRIRNSVESRTEKVYY